LGFWFVDFGNRSPGFRDYPRIERSTADLAHRWDRDIVILM